MNYKKIFIAMAAIIALAISFLSLFSDNPWQTMAGFWMLVWVIDVTDKHNQVSALEKRIELLENKPSKKLFKD
jgi:hypothetical protein